MTAEETQVVSRAQELAYRTLAREGRRLSYSTALAAMKAGFRVQREGWNGKGMWICLGEGAAIRDPEHFWNKHTRRFAQEKLASSNSDLNPLKPESWYVEVLPYFIMKTADDKILMGWLASQSDMVAEDWIILED